METVKDLLGKGMAINLMTPIGYIVMTANKANEVADAVAAGKLVELCRHNAFSGSRIKMDREEIKEMLDYKLVEGGYNHNTNAFEYMVG